MKVKPLGTRVLVRPEEEELRTKSGILLPETAKEKPQMGVVVAIGDEEEDIKVKVGQKVLFPKYTGTEIKIDGEEHLIMDSDDILAIVEE
ncbi:MAG TPA: co-chaperone GroES [Anaerolineae bacterium]|nr:co-chaperone GroES [Anaerolineae bacterium]HID85143.1 co-chaperone GroES [Anaerolineales bacterium]HIQ08110.1 co-chaperone GroES [Anaerolineaceae bacterium]